jgi:N-acetylneuraminic acid mutarotase
MITLKRIFLLSAIVFVLPFSANPSFAQQIISYQGLATNNGTPLSGTHNLALAIYADSTASTAIYTESQFSVPFTNGLFNIQIGTNPANPLPIFDAGSYNNSPRPAPNYFLGVSIDGGAELTPRSKLATSPTAWSSQFADSARASQTALTLMPSGVVGQVFTSNGTTYPTWQNAPGLPSGAIILFADSGSHPGYTYTGMSPVGGNTWLIGTPLPNVEANGRCAVVNGKIYVFGGWSGSSSFTYNQIYDPVANSWSSGAAMPIAQYATACAAVNGKIYVIGGLNGSRNNNQIYDPAANSWSTGATLPVGQYSPACAVVNGKIYVLGGSNSPFTSNQIYDPVANSWSTGAALPVGEEAPAAVALNGLIYVIAAGNTQIYDPASNTWSTGAAEPAGAAALAMMASVVNGKIYVMGGTGGSGLGNYNINEIYDPVANTWSAGSVLPVGALQESTSAVVNGNIYLLGGYNGSSSLNSNLIYTPPLNLYYFSKN